MPDVPGPDLAALAAWWGAASLEPDNDLIAASLRLMLAVQKGAVGRVSETVENEVCENRCLWVGDIVLVCKALLREAQP